MRARRVLELGVWARGVGEGGQTFPVAGSCQEDIVAKIILVDSSSV